MRSASARQSGPSGSAPHDACDDCRRVRPASRRVRVQQPVRPESRPARLERAGRVRREPLLRRGQRAAANSQALPALLDRCVHASA